MAETSILRSSAIVRNGSPGASASGPVAQVSGALPVVQVNMNAGGPQQQGGQQVRQGVTILPPKAGTRNFATGGLPNQPAKQSVVVFPPKGIAAVAASASPLTADQLMLCRHLAVKYLDEQKAVADVVVDGVESEGAANIKLAEQSIVAIDAAIAELTAAAAMAAAAAAAPPPPSMPRQAQPGTPRMVISGPRQVAAGAAPRRVARPAPPAQPMAPVIVKMDNGQPVPDDVIDVPSQG